MTQQQAAGCVVFSPRNQQRMYLLVQNVRGNHWEFPKGRIEPGESKEQAALRELKEETNLDGTLLEHFHETMSYISTFDGEPVSKIVFFFIAHAHNQEPQLSHEHLSYGWFSYQDALQKLTHSNSREILVKAHHFLDSLLTA